MTYRERATLLPSEERVQALEIEIDTVDRPRLDIISDLCPLRHQVVLFGSDWQG